jgi:hypothetical protein
MCSDNPELPKEANKAKCFVIACFVFSFFSMIGFIGGIPGVIGGIGGLLAIIASSILICCAPKTPAEGPGKFNYAFIMLLIAGVLQIAMAIGIMILLIMALTAVNNENDWCTRHYTSCDTADNGCSCSDGSASGYTGNNGGYCSGGDFSTDGLCYKDPDWEGATSTCDTEANKKLVCEVHAGDVKAAVSGIIAAIMGIAIIFQATAGILNTCGAMYCLKAKKAMISVKP